IQDYTSQTGIPNATLITNIIQDESGTIWLASRGMIVALRKQKRENTFSFQHTIFTSPDIQSVVTSLYLDHENRLWVGTHNNGVFLLDHHQRRFIAYPYKNNKTGSDDNEIRCFYEL